MAQSDKAKKNFEEIKKSTKETMDFIKEMSKDFPDVVNYAKRLASTFSDAKKLSGDQLKVLKSTNDNQFICRKVPTRMTPQYAAKPK